MWNLNKLSSLFYLPTKKITLLSSMNLIDILNQMTCFWSSCFDRKENIVCYPLKLILNLRDSKIDRTINHETNTRYTTTTVLLISNQSIAYLNPSICTILNNVTPMMILLFISKFLNSSTLKIVLTFISELGSVDYSNE